MQHDPFAPDAPLDSGRKAWAAALLWRRPELLSRYQLALARLRALPGGARRRIKRRAAVSLAGAALLLALSSGPLLTPRAHAATISVGGGCSLIDAMRSANADTAYGACAAGSGTDVITLTGNVNLTTSYGSYYASDTGLPLVTSDITIDGNGFTISRAGAAPNFRLLAAGSGSDLTLREVTLSGGHSAGNGGGVYAYESNLTLDNVTLSGNYAALDGGGLYITDATLIVRDSTVTGNAANRLGSFGGGGGGLLTNDSTVTIENSTISDNTALRAHGAGVYFLYSIATVRDSTVSGNNAARIGGGIVSNGGFLYVENATVSGNYAYDGGGIFTEYNTATISHTTVTGNSDNAYAGGVELWYADSVTITNSLISGNDSLYGSADEVYSAGTTVTSAYNVLGHDGIDNATAFDDFVPDITDVTATSDGADPTALGDILDTTLAGNGGPTLTHALVAGSPAIDLVPAGLLTDQRGFPRPAGAAYDAGAFEYDAAPQFDDIFVTALRAGVTDDALAFGPHDILAWDGSAWSKWFDGTAAGLTPNGKNKHNIGSIWIPDSGAPDVVMAFVQNARFVPGISGKVDGMDLVWWDGSAFTLWFDGQDVGLTNQTHEKIDALHVLDGSLSPVGGNCLNYLLISTQGAGRVPGVGGSISFRGEDVLGFCQTNVGSTTAGFWHKLIDGSDEGMPANSTSGLSFSEDGQVMYLMTHKTFSVDTATGGHSMVYRYDFPSGAFSGPYFIAADAGLHEKVNGLQVDEPALIP